MSFEVFKSELKEYALAKYPESQGSYFGKATQTKLENLSYKYGIGFSQVLELYLTALFEVIAPKVNRDLDSYYVSAMQAMLSDDYRQVWYKINNKLQSKIALSGAQRAKEWAKWRNGARKIIKNDHIRLTAHVESLQAKLDSGDLPELKADAIKSAISRYKLYLAKAKNPEAIGHFAQRLHDYPHITT